MPVFHFIFDNDEKKQEQAHDLVFQGSDLNP
jgi:hypothetical protein